MQVKAKLAAAVLSISVAGLALIQGFEGTETTAYADAVGVPTICTGSTKGVYLGQTATLQECEERLEEDVTYAGAAIRKGVHVKLTQGQYDALVSLVFNIGPGAFSRSTLLKRLNDGQCHTAADEFLRWKYAKGKALRGLLKRRQAERELFIRDC